MIILFVKDDLVGEAEASYSADTGKRTDLRLHLFRRGPRGGRYTIWKGTPEQLMDHIADLAALYGATRDVPEQIEVNGGS